jgi:hypothetical protein
MHLDAAPMMKPRDSMPATLSIFAGA